MGDERTRQDYWTHVREEVAEAIERGIADNPDCERMAREAAEGILRESEPDWIIYYHHAALVMVYTEHDDAAFEAGGLEGCKSWGDCVSRAAAYAYQADLADELESSWADAWEEHEDASAEEEEEETAMKNR